MSTQYEWGGTRYTISLISLAASTTQYPANGMPCIICHYPAKMVVADYVEREGGIGEELLVPLCGGHMRPALFTRLDGSTANLDDALDEIRERLGLSRFYEGEGK